jgi:hypothetical protein
VNELATDLIGARVEVYTASRGTMFGPRTGTVRMIAADRSMMIEGDDHVIFSIDATGYHEIKILPSPAPRALSPEAAKVLEIAEFIRNKNYSVKGTLSPEDRSLFDGLGIMVDDMRLRENRSAKDWRGPRDQPWVAETKAILEQNARNAAIASETCAHLDAETVIWNVQEAHSLEPRKQIALAWCPLCGAYKRTFDGREVGGGEPQWHSPTGPVGGANRAIALAAARARRSPATAPENFWRSKAEGLARTILALFREES